jgi:nitrogen regulatory protein PII
MKLIIATIRPDKFQSIQQALNTSDAYVIYIGTVGDVKDSVFSHYRGAEYHAPRPRLRLEIVVVNDLVVQDVIDAIVDIASEPNQEHVGNGSIFVMPLDEWIRIPPEQPRRVIGEHRVHEVLTPYP